MAHRNYGQYGQNQYSGNNQAQERRDGHSQGSPYHVSQPQWIDGAGYAQNRQSNGVMYQPPPPEAPPQSPRIDSYGYVSGYGDQIQAQSEMRSPSSYNPQQYAPQVPTYNPQAYSPANVSYPSPQQAYNPTRYTDVYSQAVPGASQQQTTYSPLQHSPASFTPHSRSRSQSGGYPQQNSMYNPEYVPSQYSPQVYRSSSIATQPQTYSTYTQPPAQMASYASPSPDPPRSQPYFSEYQDGMASSEPHPSISPALPGLPSDDLRMPSPPSHSTPLHSYYTPTTENNTVSPMYTPEPTLHEPPPPAPPHRAGTIGRHPQSRPLPGPPEPDELPIHTRTASRDNLATYEDERRVQDDLFDELESAILNAGGPASIAGASPHSRISSSTFANRSSPRSLYGSQSRGTRSGSQLNGHTVPESFEEDEESDPEAAAGLEAMRAAEEEEQQEDERRRQSGANGLFRGMGSYHSSSRQSNSRQSISHSRHSSIQRGIVDEDFANVDMSTYSGGYEANLSYGGDPTALAAGPEFSSPMTPSVTASSAGSLRRVNERELSYDYGSEMIQPPPAYHIAARVESGGLGGLADPATERRRRSFDEGDEFAFNEEDLMPNEPYYPPPSSHRPLPPRPPSTSDSSIQGVETPASSISGHPPYPIDAGALVRTSSGVLVPRSASLIHSKSAPSIEQPMRSKTDAEDRARRQGYRSSLVENRSSVIAARSSLHSDALNGASVALDLPSLPSKRFTPAKLGSSEFKKCGEPWAFSSIHSWLRQVANPEEVQELKESTVKQALAALFTHKVPTMNITDVEALSDIVVEEMYKAGTLQITEEWVRLCPGSMSGVIPQLTMSGCYSQRLHDHVMPGRCYSYHCQRTLRKVDLSASPVIRSSEDWATFYKLKKEDVEGIESKEIERQNILHEIVQTEEGYMEQLTVLQTLYRDALLSASPAIIEPKRLRGFVKDVFGKVDAIREANEQHLLAQLKYRQIEQGPWIKGFSDIFRQWIRKARVAYVDYAAGFPAATMLMRQERERNLDFRAFVDRARSNKLSNKLEWDTYLKAPITRLQRYSLLLFTVHKNMKQESEEKDKLQVAIDEIKAVTLECDARVAEMQRKVILADLGQKLMLRPGMQQDVELNLNHLGRELIYRGDLQRTGGSRFNWLDCHALLFDHYMILSKSVYITQKGTGAKVEKYDVSRLPIPMDLLTLDGLNDDAVMKSTYMRGLSSVTSVPSRTSGTPDLGKFSRTSTGLAPNPSGADRSNTTSSGASLQTTASAPPAVTTLDTKDSDKIIYPFRIKHLGREPYVLFAPSAANRTEWGNKIIEAKTRHANALYAQNAEPFKLRVIADSAFHYDYVAGGGSASQAIIIKGTPMDRAVQEVEQKFKNTGRPQPICRARVNCATSFTTPYPGKHMVAVGTDYGVYASEIDNPRGWTKAINIPKVTQIAVLEEFNLLLLLSNGALIAYHLDIVSTTDRMGSSAPDGSSARKAPQKISGSRDVGFFAVGRMKERTLVFYKKREALQSTFKVLEPVFQKSTEKKRGMFKRGSTEFFRDYDEFYIPTECSGINLFQSSLTVSSNKGFEVLTLDKKQTFSVPDLRAPEVANIATHIEHQSTLGMLRLSDQEYLLCYEKCAVYVNKHGDVSRSVIMTFVGRARAAALYGPYLVLFDTDFVEVRNAQNGRLKQIIAGREVKCLDDGGGGTLSGGSFNSGVVDGVPALGVGSRTVKVVMQHPENERGQIVAELVLNEGLKE